MKSSSKYLQANLKMFLVVFKLKKIRNMKQFNLISLFFLLFVVVTFVNASQGFVDYTHPEAWDGNCQVGTSQSPIDINTKNLEFCPNMTNKFKYLCVANPLQPEGLSFTIPSTGAGYIGINDKVGNGPAIRLYQTKQFHFHVPSEHTVNGKSYPLEMHNFFVAMSNEDGTNVTLTKQFVNFNTSTYINSSVYAAVLSYHFYPSDASNAIDLNVKTDDKGIAQVNRLEIFGCTASRFWYHYRGSTTAPPCTQTVDWFVYREPLPIKTSNYNAIKAAINNGNANARPTQNLNNRKVYIVGDACPTTSTV